MRVITAAEVDSAMTWPRAVAALREGHKRGKPQIGDVYLGEASTGLLTRAAWISGMGSLVKAASVFPANVDRSPALPTVQGAALLMDPEAGSVIAAIDGACLTKWKTAADSALGSELLSRPDAATLTMIGAGAMAESLIRAHITVRPSVQQVTIWNRSAARTESLALRLGDLGRHLTVTTDLAAAVRSADIICSATMSTEPLIRGAWLKPGAHLDLVGAYTAQMREADDEAARRSRVFVDFRGTTIHHIGELMAPIASGAISEGSVLGDLYDLIARSEGRQTAADITFYKNGGGAHLDLMMALAIVDGLNQTSA